MSEELEGEGFVIKDKRSSQLSNEELVAQEKKEKSKEAKEVKKEKPAPGKEPSQPFEIDFSTFILSLTSSAFYHLGDMADPTTGEKTVNLPAVKQTIDMLTMLKEKTQGNLTGDESKLLEQLIYELQMKYVSKTQKP